MWNCVAVSLTPFGAPKDTWSYSPCKPEFSDGGMDVLCKI
jgi:hypothetical protein